MFTIFKLLSSKSHISLWLITNERRVKMEELTSTDLSSSQKHAEQQFSSGNVDLQVGEVAISNRNNSDNTNNCSSNN